LNTKPEGCPREFGFCNSANSGLEKLKRPNVFFGPYLGFVNIAKLKYSLESVDSAKSKKSEM
jgi:hypothetical protein